MSGEHPELGYEFHAYPSGAPLGYAGLDVYLTAAGQDDGFAPAELIVPAWGQGGGAGGNNGGRDGGITKLTLTVHWPGSEEIHVAPGIITIRSHGGDSHGGEQQAYCFGGSLTCRRTDGRLHCRLTSPAPILNLGEEGMDWSDNVVLRVVDSIESDIAACRAQFASQANGGAGGGAKGTANAAANAAASGAAEFDARLQRTDPRLLYAVGLTLAQRSFGMLPEILRTERYWDEHAVLTRAVQEAQQAPWWPADPSLPAVLPPSPA